MESLMHLCMNWGNSGCHPEISQFKHIEIKEGEDIKIWPVGPELKKLDDLCRKCDHHIFIVETKECPFCESADVDYTGAYSKLQGWLPTYQLKCNKCEAIFATRKDQL